MTPDEARRLLDGTTPAEDWWYSVKGGWVRHLEPVGIDAAGELDVSEDDAALIVAAPALAAMLAGMREEWGVEVTHSRDGDLHTRWGYADRKDAEAFAHYMGRDPRWSATRIIRRYVTDKEPHHDPR